MKAIPEDWVLRPLPGGAFCVPAGLAESADEYWFDPRRPDALPVTEGGRQAAWFVDGDHGPAVLRHYRRGGLRAKLGPQGYAWMGQARVRAFAEARVLQYLHRSGVSVPAPLAAAYWRRGCAYRAAILVARIDRVRTLATCLDRADPVAVATALQAMHAARVWHADLNAYNVLLGSDGQVWLIDFDRARLGVVSAGQRRKNLLRLRRSLVKVAGAHGAQWWDALDGAYRQQSA